jgi:GDP-4-dehydro-6-deoxy-D-mannose reductase
MYKILLTGSTGFVGKALKKHLLMEGHEIIEFNQFKSDIFDLEIWDYIPVVDLVIHAAALTSVPDSWSNTYKFIKTNYLGTICVLEYCKKHKTRLIFFSSYLYGTQSEFPTSEEATLKSFNPYSLSKKNSEEACEFYFENFNLPITIIRPFNIYGAGQSKSFLIPQILHQIISGEEIEVKDLNPCRDYLYVKDLINLISKVVDKDYGFIIINAGSGCSYSVLEIINIIQEVIGSNLKIVSSVEYRKSEINFTMANISKANKFYNWSPLWSIRDGINDIISELNLRYP